MYSVLTNAQAKTVIDSEQIFLAYKDMLVKGVGYGGGMHWKVVGGREYLYRTLDRKGNARSLGARSSDTEKMLIDFTARKAQVSARRAELKAQLHIQARVNVAHRVGHVPNEVADLCIELDAADLLDKNIMVIGTNALHVYEAMAGVRFPSDIMATMDIDLFWIHTAKLSLVATKAVTGDGLLGLLRRADKSYEIMVHQNFRAVTHKGYMVDLIRQMPKPPWADERDRFASGDMVATDIWNMAWMLGAPRVIQPVIAFDGRPFLMSAPDPRAFALFKLWLSKSLERNPLKKARDLAQAQAVIHLVNDRLPHLGAKWSDMQSFPSDLLTRVMQGQAPL